jgi:hypothetical protein
MALDVKTWVPQGFAADSHPMVSAALERRMARIGKRRGPISILARVRKDADLEVIAELFGDNPAWGARTRLPRLFEVDVLEAALNEILARTDLFAWVDVSARLIGNGGTDEDNAIAVRIAVADDQGADVTEAVKSLGGTVLGSGTNEVLARIPGSEVADILRHDGVEALDIVR